MERKRLVLLALATVLCVSAPAFAQMRHFDVGTLDTPAQPQKPVPAPAPEPGQKIAPPDSDDAAQDYGGGSFVVTPVQDCFKQLSPGEAAEVRRNSINPYGECQRRLKARADEKAKKEKADKEKDKPKEKDKAPPVIPQNK